MMLNVILTFCLLFISYAWAASMPQGSTYDHRMQHVAYNRQNATVVNTRPGYLTMLLFDEDEQVLDAQAGFAKGWTVTKSDNRVGIIPNPIIQPVTDATGTTINQVFSPTSKDWKTNLFVVTSQRDYSMELDVLDQDTPTQAFVIRYQYPEDARQKSATASAAQLKKRLDVQEKQRIATAFSLTETPRNWRYTKRVAIDSALIAPDFAYDDGRFTYLGFSAVKTLPSPFTVVNGKEQVTTPQITHQGNYTVLAVRALSPHLVLRYGRAVVGIENAAFGKTGVTAGDTVSPAVSLEAK